jgi:hypothetical protein
MKTKKVIVMPAPAKKDAPSIDLKLIAKSLANLNEDHKLDQIVPAALDGYFNANLGTGKDGNPIKIKYLDAQGVEHYKTKFSEAEAEKLADSVFDKLSYHANLRRFAMTPEQYETLRKVKDKNGNFYTDTVAVATFGIDREGMRQTFKANKKELTPQLVQEVVGEAFKHHQQQLQGDILKKIEPKHLGDLKNFISENQKKYDLDPEIFNPDDIHQVKDAYRLFGSIASHYKSYKPGS